MVWTFSYPGKTQVFSFYSFGLFHFQDSPLSLLLLCSGELMMYNELCAMSVLKINWSLSAGETKLTAVLRFTYRTRHCRLKAFIYYWLATNSFSQHLGSPNHANKREITLTFVRYWWSPTISLRFPFIITNRDPPY